MRQLHSLQENPKRMPQNGINVKCLFRRPITTSISHYLPGRFGATNVQMILYLSAAEASMNKCAR